MIQYFCFLTCPFWHAIYVHAGKERVCCHAVYVSDKLEWIFHCLVYMLGCHKQITCMINIFFFFGGRGGRTHFSFTSNISQNCISYVITHFISFHCTLGFLHYGISLLLFQSWLKGVFCNIASGKIYNIPVYIS